MTYDLQHLISLGELNVEQTTEKPVNWTMAFDIGTSPEAVNAVTAWTKNTMPAELLPLLRTLKKLLDIGPIIPNGEPWVSGYECIYCEETQTSDEYETHDPNCSWLRGQKFLAQERGKE